MTTITQLLILDALFGLAIILVCYFIFTEQIKKKQKQESEETLEEE